MNRNRFRNYLVLLIFINIWILPSCKTQQSAEKKIISQTEMDSFHFRAVHEFPNYDNISAIISLLKDLDLIYFKDALNSVDNIDKYTDNDLLTAANIGVYMTDMGYMWSQEQEDDAFNYNVIVLSLADRLDMAKDFLESFFKRYDDEDADPDSILLLMERDLREAIKQFPEERRLELYSAMLTGSFMEKLYLLYEMIKRCPEISITADLMEENMQRLVWIATGQIKALEALNKTVEEYGIPREDMLCHEELIMLDSIMKETDFLQDSLILNALQIPEDPEFLNIYTKVSTIRNLITNPESQAAR
jgi:hypothetical protein